MKYATGRTYDKPQVLEIQVTEITEKDEFGFQDFTATFVDESRRIAGTVEGIIFGDGSDEDVGGAVLACYDMGFYKAGFYEPSNPITGESHAQL